MSCHVSASPLTLLLPQLTALGLVASIRVLTRPRIGETARREAMQAHAKLLLSRCQGRGISQQFSCWPFSLAILRISLVP